MNSAPSSLPTLAQPALLAAVLLAVAPVRLRGANLRAPAGLARDAWIDTFCTLARQDTPIRVPPSVTADALDGGLDLSATLTAGRTVQRTGLLCSAAGRTMLLAMAERWPRDGAARIAAAMDRSDTTSAFCVIGLDEGIDDECPPEALLDRVAFHVFGVGMPPPDRPPRLLIDQVSDARARLPGVDTSAKMIELFVEVAVRFGITSSRPVQFAVQAARAHASLCGRQSVDESDVTVAAALVLAPRAVQFSSPSEDESPRDPQDLDEARSRDEETASSDQDHVGGMPDRVAEACATQLPKCLLDGPQGVGKARKRGERGRKHAGKASAHHGRAIGLRKGLPKRGERVSLSATLLAAAPWQTIRRRNARLNLVTPRRRFHFLKDDLRIHRHQSSQRITTVFSVDASGSSAAHRLAEAKGAVEQLLAQSYVRRDRVALVAFRARKAEVLLPPTRSLARARRALAELPGGGATPLASGIREAHHLASAVYRSGQECHVVLLTDGRANVDTEGRGGRAAAREGALVAARCLRADGIASIVIDISPSPGHESLELAQELGAMYVTLPHGSAESISHTVRSFRRVGRKVSSGRSV